MKKFLLRYSVFLTLIIMAIGLVFILHSLSIRQKAPVQLFVTGARSAKAYTIVPASTFQKGDTIEIVQTSGGNLSFTIDSIYAESAGQVFLLTVTGVRPLPQALGGTTYTQGYIHTGRTPVLHLVLEKLR